MYVPDKRTILNLIKIFLYELIALTAISAANAENLTLSWNPSPSAEVSGYKLHYGKVSGQYTNNIDVGNTTTYTLNGFLSGQKYYIAATAYCSNCDGVQESDFSEELEVVVPTPNDSNISTVISPSNWRLVYVDSEEVVKEDGGGGNAFDGDPNTFWHTEWSASDPLPPHEIQIDLGELYELERFHYLPRQDGNSNGRIKDYAFYVSSDGVSWGDPVASGAFPNSADEQEAVFEAPVTGQFIRLVALSEVHNGPWTAVGELKVVGIPASPPIVPTLIPQRGWKLVYVDSEEVVKEDGRGVNAFDGDPTTFWHTEWSANNPPPPHEIQIDLGEIYKLEGFHYLPRQDGNSNGRIKAYAFYVSSDGFSWGNPVASGTFPNSAAEQKVTFNTPVIGQFIRLVALSEINGNPWTAVAELNVVGMLSSNHLTPKGTIATSEGSMAGETDDNVSTSTLPPPMEIGEVIVNHDWTRVTFQQNFADPVVVAPSLSYAGTDPGIVRIRNITSEGFDVRTQEWDYLDGVHTKEKVHFIVMERGHHMLPNGARIEAGTIETDVASSFDAINFQHSFSVSPVVLTTVTSDNSFHAVTVRKKEISTKGFSLLLQGEEANNSIHRLETVDYIAAEPSLATDGSIPFEIGRTEEVMNHNFQIISFLNAYGSPPLVAVDLQTSNGMDTASLRWNNNTSNSITVKVEEEQSMDDETKHTYEAVGYIVFGLDK